MPTSKYLQISAVKISNVVSKGGTVLRLTSLITNCQLLMGA